MAAALQRRNPVVWLARIRASLQRRDFYLVLPAIIVGGISGVAVTMMSGVAQLAHVLIYGIAIDHHLSANDFIDPKAAFASLGIAGLILGVMEWFRRRRKIPNVVDPIEANALRGGRMSLRDSVVLSAQTIISNGCGASVGLEAAYTQFGAGIASFFGRLLRFRRSELRMMVGCGAAGAIAAAFGAPFTGAFYACELVVGVYSVAGAAPVLAAAVAGALVAKTFGGAPYHLEVTDIGSFGITQYAMLLLLATSTSVLGIVVMRCSAIAEKAFAWVPVLVRPMLGGLAVAALAIITPQVLAAGHGAMLLDIQQSMGLQAIAVIIALKIVACLVSLASGFRGGLFFASLFVGSLCGKFFALACVTLGLTTLLDVHASILVGMATLGVAIVGGPLTMAFLVLETTRNVEVTAVVLACCIATSVLVRTTFGHSFSTWRLHLRGETIHAPIDIGWLRSLTVAAMMNTNPPIVSRNATVASCRDTFLPDSQDAVIVVDENDCYVSTLWLTKLFQAGLDADAPIGTLFERSEAFLVRSMNARQALRVFSESGVTFLAVVDSVESRRICGSLTEATAHRRYVEEVDKFANSFFGADQFHPPIEPRMAAGSNLERR